MKYYSTWQEAFIEFIQLYGHNYQVAWNLAEEFEMQLGKNRQGRYFLNLPKE